MAEGAPVNPGLSRLDAYLDGVLTPEERAAFEAEVARDPELRAQLALQTRIDDRLVRLLGRSAGARAHRSGRWTARRWAIAAVLTLAALPLCWFGIRRVTESPLETAYRVTVASGFVPREVCTTDDEFRRWVREKYSAGLEPAPDRRGVEYVGWSYATVFGPYTGLLLARVDGREVVVVLDRREQADRNPARMPFLSRLNVYERRIGKMALYEVSPLDHPGVLDSLREVPDPPAP